MRYSNIEFLIATAFFVLMLYVGLQSGSSSTEYDPAHGRGGLSYLLYNVVPNLSLVVITYSAFLFLNYYVLPKYWFQNKPMRALLFTGLTVSAVGTVFTIAQSYLRDWIYKVYGNGYRSDMALFSRGFSMALAFLLIYGIYVLLREGIVYQHQQYRLKRTLKQRVLREVLLTLSTWLAVMLPFLILHSTGLFRLFGPIYIFVLPFCFCLYFLNLYWLIPSYQNGKFHNVAVYLFNLLGVSVLLGAVDAAFILQLKPDVNFIGYVIIFWLPPVLISIIISWWVYVANREKYQELTNLQTALGASDANLQFLRSQINPHFLFNVLNTLYGTALQEQAEKTGDGIQKLGDMMRFMLHENTLDKIPLSREMEYLHNYIDLQNMRIAVSENIKIAVNITEQYNALGIAPMLLIPFIENAYKHGISFQHQSWINISLQLTGNVLQLDVYNSLHQAKENDPEKQRSGIGLENVKQRLQLLYPDRYELIIRHNPNEFFIHLTLQLS
jgi:two-component system LytT family sensor kinase